MADLLEEKKDKFSIAINHYAQEQRTKIEQEIEAYKKKELEESETQALTECYRLVQKEMAQMRGRIAVEIAKREIEAKRSLLKRRGEIASEVFARASDQLKKFTGTAEYAVFLEKAAGQVAKLFHRPGIVICLRDEDRKYQDAIRKAVGFDCSFQPDPTVRLGGLKAFHPEVGMLADETLDTLLDDQYEWLKENSGLSVI